MRVKKFLKILAYVLIGFVVTILLIAGVTQTQIFRDSLRSFALSRFASVLNAEVHLGTITGNLISGFSVDHISLKVGDDYLIDAERLDLRYDLFEIPGKTISIDNFTLVKPRIALLRGRDGVWNFAKMIKPSEPDTSSSGPFAWKVRIKHLKIDDASFALVDSAALARPDHTVDDPYFVEYHKIGLQHLSLETSLTFNENEKRAVISSLSFDSEHPGFALKEFSGDFNVASSGAQIRNMVLKTGGSSLRLDAAMKDFNLFKGIELNQLQKKPVRLSLHAHDIDLNELKRFIPQIDFLGSSISLDLDAGGEFGELDVKELKLATGSSEYHITGGVYNLHTPSKLYLNTKFEHSTVYPPDAQAVLRGIDLPDLRYLGKSILTLTFVGTPLDFKTDVSLQTDAGTVHADAALTIGGTEKLKYKGDIEYHAFDVSGILNSGRLQSKLNGELHVEGRGTTLKNLLASMDLRVDSSEFAGRHIDSLKVHVDGAEQKLTGHGSIEARGMRADLTTTLDERNETTPSFSLDGTFTSLNLADLLNDPATNSDLNFAITSHGTGLTWGSLNGEALLSLLPSRYREYTIDSSEVRLVVNQRNPADKQLELTSKIADLTLSGAFNTEYMKDLIDYEVLNLRRAIGEKFVSLDSTLVSNIDPRELAELERKLSTPHENLDAAFSLRIKNLEPISVATGNRTFNGIGVLSGTMKGNFHDLSLSARLTADDFFYGNADSGILIQNGMATLDVSSLKPHVPLRDIGIRLVADAEKMHINRSEFDSLRVTFKYEQEYSSYTSTARYNHDTHIVIKGFSNIVEDYLVFTLNDFQLGYKDFAWQADGGASIGFGTHGIRVSNLAMHRDSQAVALSGSLVTGTSITGSLSARNINLEDLRYVLAKEELETNREAFKGAATFRISANGTLQNPAYTASLNARDVSFRGVPLGQVNGTFQYGDQLMTTSVDVTSNRQGTGENQPDLIVKGTLPLNLALAPSQESGIERPMNLHVQSRGIQMGILDPILPTFNELSGILKCDATIGGSTRHPVYTGNLSIDSCAFLFVPNLISYTFAGHFAFNGDRINVVDATVRSNPLDDQFKRAGLLQLAGDFALKDFKPSDFKLTATGGLLVVRETTRNSSLSVYGNLFIQTGSNGLRYTGDIEQSELKGYVLVKNSSLIFPPTQQVPNEQFSNTVPIRLVNDTVAVAPATPASALTTRYFGTDNESQDQVSGSEFHTSKSFVDGIRYDLTIECAGGNTEIKMIFNSATGEELDANINGKFSITEDGKRWVGALSVERAYYRFIKQFDATGSIKYSGNFLNPELDITATYEGLRTSPDSTSSNRPEKVVVSMHITGTRLAPKLQWSMMIDDVDYDSYKGPKSSDVQSDAIAFILAGTFPLSKSQANDVAADLGPTARSSLVTGASSLITGAVAEFLKKKTTIINYFELRYGTERTFGEAVDIRIGGSALGGLWRYGGKILSDPFSNANVSLLYSLGDVLERPTLRNFMFELQRTVETSTIGDATDKKQINSARLFYRFSF